MNEHSTCRDCGHYHPSGLDGLGCDLRLYGPTRCRDLWRAIGLSDHQIDDVLSVAPDDALHGCV